ncbi:MAG: CarboxypepD reg-like domain [Fibrobacterota bacterium]|jgi:hypothetical protein
MPVLGLGMVLLLQLGLQACGEADSAVHEVPVWNYSGQVLDGSSDSALAGAVVQYVDEKGARLSTVTDQEGRFHIAGLPYGSQTLRFSCVRQDLNSVRRYGDRLIPASSYNESSTMPGTLASSSRVVRLFPLDASLRGEIYLRVAGNLTPARNAQLALTYRDTTFVNVGAGGMIVRTDSTGRFQFSQLPADSGYSLTVARFQQDGRWYHPQTIPTSRLLSRDTAVLGRTVLEPDSAADYREPVVQSNVLDASGAGLSSVPVNTVPWYRIAFPFDASRLDVRISNGTAALDAVTEVHGDTVLVRPSSRLPADAWLTVEITGLDKSGVRFRTVMDGSRRFRTRKALAAVESNAWATSAAYKTEFTNNDTLWVRFSEALSPDLSQLQWSASSAGRSLYGRGANVNSQVWVRAETLFVSPDQRAKLDTVGKLGFNLTAVAASGSASAGVEITSAIAQGGYAIAWSNAVDASGRFRDDLGTRDSVMIVLNRKLGKYLGFQAPGTGILPPGIQAGDVHLRGDTVVFVPGVGMTPGAVYGLSLDLQAVNGTVYRRAVEVRWRTQWGISIVSLDNRSGSEFRRFAAWGDSLQVTFSQPVDTASPFVVHAKDVKGNAFQALVSWDPTLTRATVRSAGWLPLANYGIATTSIAAGDSARAVSGMSFDLVTRAGEKVHGLVPAGDTVRLYTEAGLCAVSGNFLQSHLPGYEIFPAAVARTDFPVDSAVRLGFNRPLDTAWLRTQDLTGFVSLQQASGPVVTSSVSFEDGGRTLVLTPAAPLAKDTAYNLQVLKLPGAGIRPAPAIGRHGGTWSGGTSQGFVLSAAFKAK